MQSIYIRLTPQHLAWIEKLRLHGLHGTTRSQVARTLMIRGFEDAFAAGLLAPHAVKGK